MNALFSRRSIRRYLPEPIEPAIIKELLAAAMAAPSAGGT
jgi:nitroreductase